MTAYVQQRLIQSVLVLLAVSVVVFFAVSALGLRAIGVSSWGGIALCLLVYHGLRLVATTVRRVSGL